MEIGILGTGNIGGTLARKFAAQGHHVRVANSRGPEGARAFAYEIGATAVDARGAVRGADLVVLSIPFVAIQGLPKDLFDDLPAAVPIVDTSNYYPGGRDPRIEGVEESATESLWVSAQIGRPVIKAFNNILASSLAELGRPSGTPGRLAIAVAGDGAAQKSTVMTLVDNLGFDPVDAGSLAESWRQETAATGYCCDYDAPTMREALAAAMPGEARPKIKGLLEKRADLGAAPTHDQLRDLYRENNGLT